MTRFERDSAVAIPHDGAFHSRIDRGWWLVMGPHGRYVASIVLRALIAAVDDAERTPRSLTIHYVSPAAEGPARVHVRQERSGRSLSALSARLEQDGRLVALALASFGRARDSLEFLRRRGIVVQRLDRDRALRDSEHAHQANDREDFRTDAKVVERVHQRTPGGQAMTERGESNYSLCL